jgi:predicted aldo/keto reductase-like oxidoreductase
MKIKRRRFIQQSALGVGGILCGTRFAAADTKPRNFDPYETVPFGKTKLDVTRLCLGTGMNGGQRQSNQTRLGQEKFEDLIHGAYDRGIRMFELADLYGTHPYLVPTLKDIPRDNYKIVSKMWWRSGGLPEKERPNADVVVARFLKELRTDYIDILLLHCVTSATWPQELRKQMDILSGFKEKGTIRALGVSCHSLEALDAAVSEPWVQCVHTRINPDGVQMDGPADKVVPILKRLRAAGKAVTGMKLVGAGKWRNDPEKRAESIRFVLGLGCVDVLNVGFESPAEIDDFAGVVSKTARA